MSKNRGNPIWSEGKKFALCLTHDVDRVKKTYQYFTHFAKTVRPYHLFSIFQKGEPYWNFGRIIKIENKYGVKSTFFFLHETENINLLHPKNWSKSIGRYDFHDEKIREIIQKLYDNGWEIGLHGSYDSYKNKDMLAKEKRELEGVIGDEVIGIRQHYLNLEIPKTWRIQHEVGFKYDTSFGYKDKIGFRDKKYTPFQPLNNSFFEIPLTIMDGALFSNYKNKDEIWRECIGLINLAEKHGGLLTLLWHQRVFNEKEFSGWSKIYEKILVECKKRNALIGTCREVYEGFQGGYIVWK